MDHPHRRRRNRESTQLALIEAASQVFAEKGFESATTRAIAETAGCSEALIQRYFKGKDGLLMAVLKQDSNELHDDFFSRPLCSSLLDEARETWVHSLVVFQKRAALMRIVISRALLDRIFRPDFQRIAVRSQVKIALETRLARYARVGLLDPSFDRAHLAEFLLSMAFQLGFVHQSIMGSDENEIAVMIDTFALVFARGASEKGTSARPPSPLLDGA